MQYSAAAGENEYDRNGFNDVEGETSPVIQNDGHVQNPIVNLNLDLPKTDDETSIVLGLRLLSPACSA